MSGDMFDHFDSDLEVMKLPAFEYAAISLKAPAFRLLRLLKGSSGPIQCQLFESRVPVPSSDTTLPEDCCDYSAVSYTWGQSLTPCSIVVNGCKRAVTKNAYLALRDLRDQENDKVLWIDAL